MGLGLHRCTKDLNSGGDLEVKNEGSHKSNSIMFEELTCGCKLCPENVGTEGETSNFIVQGTLREGPVKLWISSVYSHTNAPLMGQMAGENSSSSTPRSCFMLFLAASRQPQQFVRRAVSRWAAVGRGGPREASGSFAASPHTHSLLPFVFTFLHHASPYPSI